eukprot:NODE_3566_length_876_cov_159.887850_g3544_i0.p1 GENE.NODE_3566_length_876_cov_159.887850_g3544_i0~~NODE_3566_length_876_cov_159.887850_g3544_i0.p1  ORF type:complete len:235 (-),score=36.21 NODE_3566_length_876_cov_159.887850_g3544_i0:85-789(-)
MALAAMYQRIPYSILSEVNKKKPQNYGILKLPPQPGDKNYAEWERNNPAATTTFDDARRNGRGRSFKDASYARWQTQSFPAAIDFETALERIEQSNNSEPRVLKYKLTFADGCHLLFVRSNWTDPSSLHCAECYNPNREFDKATAAKAQTQNKSKAALADANGHLLNRKRDEAGHPIVPSHTSAAPCGTTGFSFTPVGYITNEVRPNQNFPGVRAGLRETNKSAYQFLRKDQNS